MAASRQSPSRYQREQRFTVVSWAVLVALGALLAAYHNWSTERSASSDDGAAPPVAPTLTMHAWLDQSQPAINGMVAARNDIAAAASRQDIAATGTACRRAADAVTDLRGHMPSPEAPVNQSLQQAISSYTAGFPFCVSASGNVDGQGMQLAARFISEGDTAMQLALDIMADEPGGQGGAFGVLIV